MRWNFAHRFAHGPNHVLLLFGSKVAGLCDSAIARWAISYYLLHLLTAWLFSPIGT